MTGIDDPTTALPGAVSARVPDWSREAKRLRDWQPSRSLMASIRSYQRLRGGARPDRAARRWLAVLRHRFWSVVTGADVPLVCRIEGGLLLPHPNGIVIHPDARIGPNCLLFQQVTLGTGGPGKESRYSSTRVPSIPCRRNSARTRSGPWPRAA